MKKYEDMIDSLFDTLGKSITISTPELPEKVKIDVSTRKMSTVYRYPKPIKIISNAPATIVYWDDGDKTVVKCDEGEPAYDDEGFIVGYVREPDKYTVENGVSAAYIKKIFGSRSAFKSLLKEVIYTKPKKGQKKKDNEVVE